jgi:hypothetical protein
MFPEVDLFAQRQYIHDIVVATELMASEDVFVDVVSDLSGQTKERRLGLVGKSTAILH